MNSGVRGFAFAAVLLGAGLSVASAQTEYPAHSVRIIVPFPPGGVVDVMARLLSKKLTEETNTPFYIDNIAGAGGNIGVRVAATAPKDGYTIMLTSSSFVVNPSLHTKVPYDPVKDFRPITIAAASPNILTVSPRESAKTVSELIASIRKAPGTYSFGSAGIGTTPHLSGELFKQSTKIDVVHVPFSGAGPALQATAGGHVQMSFSGVPPAVPLVKNGTIRALAVTSAKRLEALPDVPTMEEAGFPGQEAETLIFVMAPSGTPDFVVGKLGGLLKKILASQDVKTQFDGFGFTVLGTDPEQSAQRIQREIAVWAKVIKDGNLRQTVE